MRVLLVEDNMDDVRAIRDALRASGEFTTKHAGTAADALKAVKVDAYDVCLVDHRLPDSDGVGLCRQLRDLGHAFPIIMISSVRQDSVARDAFDAGVNEFLLKDIDYGTWLVDRIRQIVGGEPDAP